MRRLTVKICGITRSEDALLAASLGATHIGLIFAPTSPRIVTPEQAACIAEQLQGQAHVVGVFQDQKPEHIAAIRQMVRLDFIQYHGSESPESITIQTGAVTEAKVMVGARAVAEGSAEAGARTEAPAIKAFTSAQPDDYRRYENAVSALLFDRLKTISTNSLNDSNLLAGKTVTGIDTIEWLSTLVESFSCRAPACPFLIAGGITADTAANAVDTMAKFEKFIGLDISSGVESNIGIKDPEKLYALFQVLKEETDYAICR